MAKVGQRFPSWRWALLALGSAGLLVAEPARREPHLRWRMMHPEPAVEVERWFMPGPLGHEPGAPDDGKSGPRAYLSRAMAGWDTPEEKAWAARNGLGPGVPFSHNLAAVFPPKLFDTHPEFFPMIEGERLRPEEGRANWNPDLGEPGAARHAAEEARRFFAANPDAVSFALGVNDAVRFGDSPATARWTVPPRYFRQRPDYSDLVYQFMNAVAAELSDELPGKHLGSLAYYWSEQAPSFPVHRRVLPFLTADRSQGYDRAFRLEEAALQRRWAAAGPERLGVYDYLYGYGFLVPRMHTRLLAEHLCAARRAGFTDYFAELYPHWGLAGPQPWLVTQLLRDPEQTAGRLLDEYYRRYYRGAARPMRRFFEECERRWMAQEGPAYWLKYYRMDSQAALFPAEARRRLRAHLAEAARRAEGDARAAERVALTSAAFGVSERFVEMVEAREALARALLPRLRAGEVGARDGGEVSAETVAEIVRLRTVDAAARQAFVTEADAVEAAWPLAFGKIHRADVLRSDWGPVADWWLASRRASATAVTEERECVADPLWRGPSRPELWIGGLLHRPALPLGWRGWCEPWEGLKIELGRGSGTMAGQGVLRLEHTKFVELRHVVLVPDAGQGVLRLGLRGRHGVLARLLVRAVWMTADYQVTGAEAGVALPAGDWGEGTTLTLPLRDRPKNAVAVIFAINVTDQQAGDWLELHSPSVRWRSDAREGGADRR